MPSLFCEKMSRTPNVYLSGSHPHTKCPGAFPGHFLRALGESRNGLEDTPIWVILQNTLEEFAPDGIINPKTISGMAIPNVFDGLSA